MEPIFRLSGGESHSIEVERWFDAHPDELGHLAKRWFDEIRATGEDVLLLIHDGCPVACVGDAAFAYVNIFTAHLNVGFFAGADLDDPAGALRGTGKRMRHVRVSPVVAYNEAALSALIGAAYADIRGKLDA